MTQDPCSSAYRPNVGIMLVNRAGRVFVAQRIDSPGAAWQMPQGGIDPQEDPRRAALRELEEETGIPPELVRIVAETAGWLCYDFPPELAPRLWKGGYRGQRQRWYLMRFLGDDSQIRIDGPEPEFSDWKWVAPAELVGLIVPFKREVYTRVLEEFAPHLEPGAEPEGSARRTGD